MTTAAPSPSPSSSPSKVVSLNLLIDKKAHKVVFAEAGKETVDFLCSILTLPVGTVARLLSAKDMEGSLPNLYQSTQNLNDDFVHPIVLFHTDVRRRKTSTETLYKYCTSCNNTYMTYDASFVKGSVMYMVTDDLVVSPTSAIEGSTLMTKLNVNVTDLEQKVVDLNMAKGLKLLKASFQTKKVLTEVFLRGSGSGSVKKRLKYSC